MSDDPYNNPIRNIILPDAKKQPDRSLAIVLAAVVEDQLGEMLRAKVVEEGYREDVLRNGSPRDLLSPD